MTERNTDEDTQHPPSPVKRQHPQLRALLFNRLGLFDVSSDGITNTSRWRTKPNNKKEASGAVTSQQSLKDDANTACIKGGAAARTNHRGVIRFNSIVSVVGIPTRSQYSNSARRLLWGKDSSSFGSDQEDDDDNTKESQDDISPQCKEQSDNDDDRDQSKQKDKPRRPRLVRKCSFHG